MTKMGQRAGDRRHRLTPRGRWILETDRAGGGAVAYRINSDCTGCGECVPKCPNDAISKGLSAYRIEPLLCTECVGYAEEPQCVEVCPKNAIHLAAVDGHFAASSTLIGSSSSGQAGARIPRILVWWDRDCGELEAIGGCGD